MHLINTHTNLINAQNMIYMQKRNQTNSYLFILAINGYRHYTRKAVWRGLQSGQWAYNYTVGPSTGVICNLYF